MVLVKGSHGVTGYELTHWHRGDLNETLGK